MSGPRTIWQRAGLSGRLRERLARNDEERRGNGLAMILSGVIAVFLWLVFTMSETYTIEVPVPLEIQSLPEEQALAERPPASARVTVQGEGWSLLPLVRDPTPVAIRATSSTVNVLEAVRESGQISSVSIQSARPESVELALDERISRLLPIRLVRQFSMEPSYDLLRAPGLAPDSVLVTGARSVIGGLVDWPTEPLVLTGLRDSVAVTVALSDTLEGLVLGKSPLATRVTVPIAAFTGAERMLDVVVRNVPSGIAGVRTDPAQIRATYTVAAERRAALLAETSDDFVAVVDYADIARDPAAASVRVSVQVPTDLDVRNVVLEQRRVEFFILIGAAAPGSDAE